MRVNIQRGISKIEFTIILALSVIIATTAFIFGTTRKNKSAENTPTPTVVYNTTQPTVTPAVIPTSTTTVISIPTPSVISLISGIKGVATLKSCISGNCTTTPIAQMKIDVKTQSGTLVTNVYTDIQGKFSVNLKPGQYFVGPFKDTTTSVIINAATVKVTRGYFSEVNPKFESQQ